MDYLKIKPCKELEPYIHFFWELKGNPNKAQWERVYPDGCSGIILNLGNDCLTDNGSLSLEFGKTYAVGAMNSYKDSLIDIDTHLAGARLKPAAFANFYSYDPADKLINDTVEFEKSNSFSLDKIVRQSFSYFDCFFLERIKNKNIPLQSVINDINVTKGQISIYELAQKNCTTVRQLERNFKKYIGLSPKEYTNIIRFQNALNCIQKTDDDQSLSDIAFECGYYDLSHFSNEIKRNTGLSPSSL